MLLIWVAFFCVSVRAEEIKYSESGMVYILDTDTKTATAFRYKGDEEKVVIPATVVYEGSRYVVTALGVQCFDGLKSITSIEIPNTVVSIGNACFFYCKSLKVIEFPASVRSIGRHLLCGCDSLESIKVDENNPVFDSRDNCNALIDTATDSLMSGCKNTMIPSTVKILGERAFYFCSDALQSIKIPLSVKKIETECFSGCSGLLGISIPNSVHTIGSGAFDRCRKLKSVSLGNAVRSIEASTFAGTSLTSISIPASVVSIGNCAFYDCEELVSLKISSSVTSIGSSAFHGCKKLVSLKIPNSITRIGDYAFDLCSALKRLDLPESLTFLGYASFSRTPLETVVCRNLVPLETYAFSSNYSVKNATLYVPSSALSDYQASRYWNIFGSIQSLENYEEGKYYPQKVVMEEATGTWCGWCVRGIATIDVMKKKYPEHFIPIAVHNDEMSPDESYAPFFSGVSGYPSAQINRAKWSSVQPFDMNTSEDLAEAKVSSTARLSEDGIIEMDTESVFSFFHSAPEEYRLAYVVVEDSVGPYMQANSYSSPDSPDDPNNYLNWWIHQESFVSTIYHDVARAIYDYDGIQGLLPQQIDAGEPVLTKYEMLLPSNVENPKNVRVVTLLLDANSGEIVNADCCVLDVSAFSAGIEMLTVPSEEAEAYDIYGRKVQKKSVLQEGLRHGVYIVGSRKVLVR